MRIIAFKLVGNYQVEVTFSNGVTKIIDLQSFLFSSKNPMTSQFKDQQLFQRVQLSNGHLSWLDGEMDLSAESLFEWK
jgi:hypothetical protein